MHLTQYSADSSHLFAHYFPFLSPHQLQQLNQLCSSYRAWNQKINLISRKDMAHLELHHITHSLSIAHFSRFPPGTQVLDLGTGGGLPGLPLAIAFPEVHFTLLDSRKKKIQVIEHLIASLALKNVTAVVGRAEEHQEKYHFILGRAVTNLYQFYQWAADKVLSENKSTMQNGLLYLNGATTPLAIKSIPWQVDLYQLSSYFRAPYFSTKELLHIYPSSAHQ